MSNSVLDAIKLGVWNFEPPDVEAAKYDPTMALPGTVEKIDVLSERLRQGLPLWHPRDRVKYADGLAISDD